MARTGISITKRVAFRDSTQEFSNVYYYESLLPPVLGDATNWKDDIVVTEKKLHSSLVEFVYYRIWSAGGTQAANQMIAQGTLSGTGSALSDSGMDKERALLAQWPAGNNIRGQPVFLRKWYHICGTITGVSMSSSILSNATGFTTANRTAFANIFDELTGLAGITQGADLVSPTGRDVQGSVQCHKYLEHHQLGDQWRG